jgi:hypothetical protein
VTIFEDKEERVAFDGGSGDKGRYHPARHDTAQGSPSIPSKHTTTGDRPVKHQE